MPKEWIRLIKKEFMYGVEEPWCNNMGVAILPYIIKNGKKYFMQTTEYNPLFKSNKLDKFSSITGGIENNDALKTVHLEMKEETGIILTKDTPIYFFGNHYSSKISTKKWYYYAIDLTKLNLNINDKYYGCSDGSEGEIGLYSVFVSEEQLQNSNDSFSLTIYGKLLHCLLTNTLANKEVIDVSKINQEEDLYNYESAIDEVSLIYKNLMF